MSTISYEEFGRRFLDQLITADRVEQTLHSVVAGDFETSMKIAGGLVRAEGTGSVTRIRVDRTSEEALSYRAALEVKLELTLRVSGVPYRYEGSGEVALDLFAVARDDLSVFVDVPDIKEDRVRIELRPLGRVAAILDQLGAVNDQVEREVARFVNEKKDERAALKARRIDIATTIEEEWQRRMGG